MYIYLLIFFCIACSLDTRRPASVSQCRPGPRPGQRERFARRAAMDAERWPSFGPRHRRSGRFRDGRRRPTGGPAPSWECIAWIERDVFFSGQVGQRCTVLFSNRLEGKILDVI